MIIILKSVQTLVETEEYNECPFDPFEIDSFIAAFFTRKHFLKNFGVIVHFNLSTKYDQERISVENTKANCS